MEAKKRKREDDSKMNEKRVKEDGVPNGNQQEVEEEEVAVKYFEKTDRRRWMPVLETEDFKEVNDDLDREQEEGNSFDQNSGLDLNLDPNPNE
ncbi:unnamed protein product [Dovyalis caffra]|uniref:Uncharacterized protein n=1 Tax=Dovyalis caffra TaxID=77055 RepID=A0AAV1QY09_9ROSI|nr:unnamed protein product [Dovyalis caffra]